jgi:hypothetical protein
LLNSPKLVLAARLVEWIAPIVKKAGKMLWIVVDGGYVKASFAIAGYRRGTTPIGVRPTPTVAKPCGDTSWSTNYRRLPPFGGRREKSFN